MQDPVDTEEDFVQVSQPAQYSIGNARTRAQNVFGDIPDSKDDSLWVASLSSDGIYEEDINPFTGNLPESTGHALYINTTYQHDDHGRLRFGCCGCRPWNTG